MIFRKATSEDLPAIVEMLADDILGSTREQFEDPLPVFYQKAFDRLSQNDDQELIVVEDENNEVIGTLHLTFLTYLTYRGGTRAQIEAVRIHRDHRGKGIGEKLFRWAIDRSKERGAHLLQLTTDKERPNTIKFYERLGFKASHIGMKLHLNQK
ncbi:MAG: GNAT superfamily N-acetyltransferase [Flavobacteriales bacterium]|jgi:GNAT superfamily N-acetyltransferase